MYLLEYLRFEISPFLQSKPAVLLNGNYCTDAAAHYAQEHQTTYSAPEWSTDVEPSLSQTVMLCHDSDHSTLKFVVLAYYSNNDMFDYLFFTAIDAFVQHRGHVVLQTVQKDQFSYSMTHGS